VLLFIGSLPTESLRLPQPHSRESNGAILLGLRLSGTITRAKFSELLAIRCTSALPGLLGFPLAAFALHPGTLSGKTGRSELPPFVPLTSPLQSKFAVASGN
jgi:hypothetical protein